MSPSPSPSLSQLAHAPISSPLWLVLSARVCGSSMCPCGSIISSFIDPIYVTGETILRNASPRVAFTLSLCTRSGSEWSEQCRGKQKGEQRFKMYHKLAQKSSLKSRGLQLSINHSPDSCSWLRFSGQITCIIYMLINIYFAFAVLPAYKLQIHVQIHATTTTRTMPAHAQYTR